MSLEFRRVSAESGILSTMAEAVPKSWVNMPPNHPFSLQNLPWGIFIPKGDEKSRIGVAIGDLVVDVGVMASAGLVGSEKTQRQDCFHQVSES